MSVDLDALARAVRDELRRTLPQREDLCVLASRVGFDALRYFGVDARPLVTRTIAFNQRWHDVYHEVDGDVNHARWENEPDAYSVAIDERDSGKPGRYPGHLVLGVPSDDCLIDLTLGQFSRPAREMPLPEYGIFPCDLGEFVGGEPLLVSHGDPAAYVAYRFRDDAPDYRRGSDWRTRQPCSGKVIRALKEVGW